MMEIFLDAAEELLDRYTDDFDDTDGMDLDIRGEEGWKELLEQFDFCLRLADALEEHRPQKASSWRQIVMEQRHELSRLR